MPNKFPAGLIGAVTLLVAVGSGAFTTERPAHPGLNYPVATRGTTVDDYHGVKVADP
jgi:hypothetical protein